jgi:dTDP-4-dehydrorhamnose reductase
MKVLVLGISGLLGSTIFKVFSNSSQFEVFGSLRSDNYVKFFPAKYSSKIFSNIEALNFETISKLIKYIKPDVIINCIGAIKHKPNGNNASYATELNALFPLTLSNFCASINAKLIHLSTDCVFSGIKGLYTEDDYPDAKDIYGKTKALGELCHEENLVIRTSTIGHELDSSYNLLNWFLSQKNQCRGYKNAIFSGLPTIVIAEILINCVLKYPNLVGLYNIAGEPINKFDLLSLISNVYGKNIDIVEDKKIVIDRSLDYTKFSNATAYKALKWECLIKKMYMYEKNKKVINV